MRKWYKYLIEFKGDSEKPQPSSIKLGYQNFSNIYGFNDPVGYESREDFYQRYYYGYHCGRLECYFEIVRKYLTKKRILSLACGRPVLESLFYTEGYDITCSDLEIFPELEKVRVLFPELKYLAVDILKDSVPSRYDTILAMGLLYLFDESTLDRFFANIAQSLPENGLLITDSAISPNTWTSYLIHDVLLKYEAYLKRLYYSLKNQDTSVNKIHFGYRKSHAEIVQIAEKNGLELVGMESGGYLIEMQRSYIARKLMDNFPLGNTLFELIGRNAPFINVYIFKKKAFETKRQP